MGATFTFSLRETVSFAICGARVVFLDLENGRYTGIQGSVAESFRAFMNGASIGSMPTEAQTTLQPLLRARILIPSQYDKFPREISIPPPNSSLFENPIDRPQTGLFLRAVATRLRTDKLLHAKPLGKILDSLRKQKKTRFPIPVACDGLATGHIYDAVQAMNAVRYFISVHDKCLITSLSMINFLGHRNFYPDLVIGVRASPFQAHAWVQAGSTVLNDRVDTVSQYRPIYVV